KRYNDCGNQLLNESKKKGVKIRWLKENFLLKRLVISVSWPTLMLVKRRLLNVSCSTLVKSIKSVKLTMVGHKWTGWSKNKNVVSLLHLLQQLHNGKTTV